MALCMMSVSGGELFRVHKGTMTELISAMTMVDGPPGRVTTFATVHTSNTHFVSLHALSIARLAVPIAE